MGYHHINDNLSRFKLTRNFFPFIMLLILILYLLFYLDLRLLLLNTLTVGGDIPAHNYLVSHLKDSMVRRFRIIDWAPGWWCGFPMFQYYFFLPYFLAALLSFFIPINIAFKLVSVSGILSLPVAMYYFGRWMSFDKYTSLLFSTFAIPFLFLTNHTMWGVNIYSTLAGEISNSISFVFFVLLLGSYFRDLKHCNLSKKTCLFMVLLIYTHFFTSIVAVLVCIFSLLIFGKKQILQRFIILLKLGIVTFLLSAWWVIPLIFKIQYSVEIGGDWNIQLIKTFPTFTIFLIPFSIYGLYTAIKFKQEEMFFMLILLIISLISFNFGGKINDSFCNIRFWPFIFFALLTISVIGMCYIVDRVKFKGFLIAVGSCIVLYSVHNSPNHVKSWVKWNYEGLENKVGYQVFKETLDILNLTPGRLANDLNENNDYMFGSVRIFEAIPALISKPILEGGIVNSAASSILSYYIQCESSKSCAGFPTVMSPTSFNIHNATLHMKLANVKHFIARWEKTKQALREHGEWKILKDLGPYTLFELISNNGNYVTIPDYYPIPVKVCKRTWKEAAVYWLYTQESINIPFIMIKEKSERLNKEYQSDYLTFLEYLSFLSILSREREQIPIWLELGPFPYDGRLSDTEALELNPVKIEELKPEVGKKQFGKTWKPIFGYGPIFVEGRQKVKEHIITYYYTTVFSSEEKTVYIDCSNDDGMELYLNKELILKQGFTGLDRYNSVKVNLKKGLNELILKLQQGSGASFFHIKLRGLKEQSLHSTQIKKVELERFHLRPVGVQDNSIYFEEIHNDRIIFKTKAINMPHIIKISYFPNWQPKKGVSKIYHVTPNFMLVYPEEEYVELTYRPLLCDKVGTFLTLGGVVMLSLILFRRVIREKINYKISR